MEIVELKKYDKFIVTGDAKVPPDAPKSDEDQVYSMGRLDGMYCWCVDRDMERHYFAAWTEVELVEQEREL